MTLPLLNGARQLAAHQLRCRFATQSNKTIKPVPSPWEQEEPSAQELQMACVKPVLLRRHFDPVLNAPDYFGIEKLVNIEEMFEARVHYGHKVGTLQENMKWALFGERLGVCIFDLDITKEYLIRALKFLAGVSYQGGLMLFVTSQRAHMMLVEETAEQLGHYSHTRKWDDGTLTNSRRLFGAAVRLPDTIIFTNTLSSVLEQHPAVKESAKMAIPSIGIVDSNAKPNYVTYPIPGNDDSMDAINYYMRLFRRAIELGRMKREEQEVESQREDAQSERAPAGQRGSSNGR